MSRRDLLVQSVCAVIVLALAVAVGMVVLRYAEQAASPVDPVLLIDAKAPEPVAFCQYHHPWPQKPGAFRWENKT